MQNNQMEDQLRQRLGSHPTPIDVDMLWGRVQPQLPEKKRLWLPLWLLLVAVPCFVASLFFRSPMETGTIDLTGITETVPPPEPGEAATLRGKEFSAAGRPVKEVDGTVTEASAPKPLSPQIKFVPVTSPTDTPVDGPSFLPKEVPPVGIKSLTTSPELNLPAPAAPEVLTESTDVVDSGSHPYPLPVFPRKPVAVVSTPNSKTPLKATASVTGTEPTDLANTEQEKVTESNAAGVTAAGESAASMVGSRQVIPAADINDFTEPEKATTAKEPGKIRVSNSTFWTVEPGIAFSLPVGVSDVDGPGSEKALEGISYQALVGYHHARGFSLRTGVVVSRINSKLEFEVTRSGSQPREAVIAIIETANGNVSEQRGIVQVATT